jgi:perosamine synthetase
MPTLNTSAILQAIRSVIGESDRPVSLHEPLFRGKEIPYVNECIETGWVSSVGKFVDRFEKDLVSYTGAKHAIATANGTAALHICLILAGVKEDEEVLMPALTFIATANAVSYCRATPHFVDSDFSTLGVDPQKLEAHLEQTCRTEQGSCFNKTTGKRIAALVVMHTFGHSVDLDAIEEICRRFHIPLIEDAAESLGTSYKGVHTGNRGVLSALSFNGNKIVTTGGGGAILTNDEKLAKRAKHLTTTAKVGHPWAFVHDEVGYNYRLPNLNAALGCAQLEQLGGFLESKRALAQKYERAFNGLKGVSFFRAPPFSRSNFWLNAILLDEEFAGEREAFLAEAHKAGILVRPVWTLMHKLKMFKNCPRADLSRAESIESRLINLPSSASL